VVLKARKLTVGRPHRHECLESDELVRAALFEMERTGIDGFSLRAAARVIGCDPAALIYRFGSREGLERAVADRLHAEIGRLDPDLPWRDRLLVMARQYRAVAQAYPRTFPVLMRYWTTGPRDLLLTEDCFRALSDAGVPPDRLPAAECGLYATLLGLCAGEAGGLVGLPTPAIIETIETEPGFDTLRRYLPQIEALAADDVFENTIGILLDGIATLGRGTAAPAKSARHERTITGKP
jgi:AcrR family transcriptional regulator